MTDPVGFLVTEASELPRVKTSQAICLPVPKLHDFRLTLSKDRMALSCATSLLDTVALRAPCLPTSATLDRCCPFMPTMTVPNGLLAAVDRELI